jgi:hypothetical protein
MVSNWLCFRRGGPVRRFSDVVGFWTAFRARVPALEGRLGCFFAVDRVTGRMQPPGSKENACLMNNFQGFFFVKFCESCECKQNDGGTGVHRSQM